MKTLIIALFAASTLFAAAPLPAFAANRVAAVCDGAVPEAWQRPGGFCDQNDFNKSLTDPSNSESCVPVNIAMLGDDRDVMLVAIPATTCCTAPISYEFNPSTGRVIVADNPCCNVGMLIDPEHDNHGVDQRDRVILAACA